MVKKKTETKKIETFTSDELLEELARRKQAAKADLEASFKNATTAVCKKQAELNTELWLLKDKARNLSEETGLPVTLGNMIYRPNSIWSKWIVEDEMDDETFNAMKTLLKEDFYFGDDGELGDGSWWQPSTIC